MFQEGSRRFQEGSRIMGARRLEKAQEGTTRHNKAQQGSKRLKKAKEGLRRLKKVQEFQRRKDSKSFKLYNCFLIDS